MAIKTKAMLQEEIEAKEQELAELREQAKQYEIYKQFDKGARDIMMFKDSLVRAGFTDKEAFELTKIAIKECAASGR
jgi:uncharacterized protein YydD (DUF2326 family)